MVDLRFSFFQGQTDFQLLKATIQSESFVLVLNCEQFSHARLGMIGSQNVEKERLLLLQVFVATI